MASELSKGHYEALAEFRHALRRFQRFSDEAARNADLEPQQHQLLLAIKGSADDRLSVGAIAERLQIQHHSAVELIARAEARNLVHRAHGQADRRVVFVTLTELGTDALRDLTATHRRELLTAAPELIRILQRIIADDTSVDGAS
ncbi:MAG: MarR family transcriptional regulator [Thermomicrobiales bacterium]